MAFLIPSEESETENNPQGSPPATQASVSPIHELQSAFQSILLSEKDRHRHASPLKPTWTGSFSLLSFPRELRDRIYFYAVYRPKGVVWRRRHELKINEQARWLNDYVHYWPAADPDLLSLFLTSRQVYEEALYVFCLCTAIYIEKRIHGQLEGTLRIFPAKAAGMLQRLELEYEYVDTYYLRHVGATGSEEGVMWKQMIQDAWLAKEYFPRLRECTALWHTQPHNFSVFADMGFEGQPDEVRVELWLRWMRAQYEHTHLVPPMWFRVRTERYGAHRYNPMTTLQPSLALALELFKDEVLNQQLENPTTPLEDTGKKWLDEAWGDGRRRRKK